MKVLIIDNYDSFTYNLVDYIATAGAKVHVARNDRITTEQAEALQPSHVVVSPGPGTPAEAGVSRAVIEHFHGRIPILGVCLGHQVICEMNGGRVDRAGAIVHGKPDLVSHDGSELYAGLPNPFEAGRYHSLAALAPIPEVLIVTSHTPDGEIMGVRHREHPTHGVQFHPESVLTPQGRVLIANFLAMEQS